MSLRSGRFCYIFYSGPSDSLINFPVDITSLISPSSSHTLAPIYLTRLDSLGSTFSVTSKNCSSVYLGRKSFLNLDCKGLDSLLILLQEPKTFAPFISKSYCFFCWSNLTRPDSMKFKSWFWNVRGILSSSSIHMTLGLSSSRTSRILFVVLEPSKYTPFFLMSRMPNRKSVFALAGGPNYR